MKRVRRLLATTAMAVAMRAASADAAAESFDYAALCDRAQRLASQPHVPRRGAVPEWLRQLSYDDLRQIEFDGRESLWLPERLPFQVQFLHPGFLYDKTVRLAEVQEGASHPISFRREYFNYRALRVGKVPPDLGFAGFRLMYPLDGAGTPPREIGSFLGASYFRFLCIGAAYGLSARGLAIDTGEPRPEEFPVFTEFWLERPGARATHLNVYALLESERVTGAYRFDVRPGRETIVEVTAAIFPRARIDLLGLAPLTSMFARGENTNTANDDYRPEVHDSDGVLIQNGAGEWLWRPLQNRAQISVTTFADENPRGFGLLQRDRNFENYQDLEASYHARPDAWVEPIGHWGRGGLRLVELPTKDEFNDNIVLLWVPEKKPVAGERVDVAYRLHWSLGTAHPPAGFVRATRHGKSALYEPGLERFVIDFDGEDLRSLGAETKLTPSVSVGEGAALHHVSLQKNPLNATWRVAFTIKPAGERRPVELRCFLRRGSEALTETWTYLWTP